jgi:hypothetical protein
MTYIGRCLSRLKYTGPRAIACAEVNHTPEEGDDSPLERDEIELPDGRRLILYSSRDE